MIFGTKWSKMDDLESIDLIAILKLQYHPIYKVLDFAFKLEMRDGFMLIC